MKTPEQAQQEQATAAPVAKPKAENTNRDVVPFAFGEIPKDSVSAWKIATWISKAGDLCPELYRGKPEAVAVAMMMGADLGLKPMQAIQNIAVINGRPALWGDAVPAVCMTHPRWGGMHETFDLDTMTATCQVMRTGEGEVIRTFSKDDAITAGLWEGKASKNNPGASPWVKYPKRMLQMRARGFALRDAFPDKLRGIILAEEAGDMEPIQLRKTESGAYEADTADQLADRVASATGQPERQGLSVETMQNIEKTMGEKFAEGGSIALEAYWADGKEFWNTSATDAQWESLVSIKTKLLGGK